MSRSRSSESGATAATPAQFMHGLVLSVGLWVALAAASAALVCTTP